MALREASLRGHSASVAALLAGGVDPNGTDMYGVPPLIYAAARGQGDIVRILLDNGAEPSVVSPQRKKIRGTRVEQL